MALSNTQEERYFTLMANSLGDKARVIHYLLPGTVLDLGAGGGELSEVLNISGYETTSLDGSLTSVEKCKAKGLTTVHAMTHEITQKFAPESFDNVVASSVLHEVYSYGSGSPDSAYTLGSLINTLNQVKNVLKTGGMFVIRDGVAPYEAMGEVRMKDKTEAALIDKYLSMIPFRGRGFNQVDLQKTSETTYVGEMHSIMEALYTYTWGENSYPRETQELYGVMNLDEYKFILKELGFEILEAYSYLQPGYEKSLIEKATIHDLKTGKQLPYPMSNMIISARKV